MPDPAFGAVGPLTVLTEPKAGLATVTLALAVQAGSRFERPPGLGTAHLLEHVLMSAPRLAGRSFEDRIDGIGGHCNAVTGKETVCAYVRVFADDAPATADWLLRAAFAPWDLDDAAVEAQRRIVLRELDDAQTDLVDEVQERFFATLFGDHPLAAPPGGVAGSVTALTADELARHHANRFRLAHGALAVVGAPQAVPAVTAQVVRSLAADALPEPAPYPPPPVGAEPARPLPVRCPPAGDVETSAVLVGGAAPALSGPDRVAAEVLAAAFDNQPGSLLYRRLRRHLGLVYDFNCWTSHFSDAGVWRVVLHVRSEHAARTAEIVQEELAAARRGLPADVLDSARRRTVLAKLIDVEDPVERALGLAQLGPWLPDRYAIAAEAAAIERVTGADVAEAAARVGATAQVHTTGGTP